MTPDEATDRVRGTYSPRVILPTAAVWVRVPDFIISFAARLALMLFYGKACSCVFVVPGFENEEALSDCFSPYAS